MIDSTVIREPRFLLCDYDALVKIDAGSRETRARRRTPRYAAPEILGGGVITAAADFWSLGIVILEALYGRHPLAERDEIATVDRIATDWRPRFHDIIDTGLRAVLGALCHRLPEQRWRTTQIIRWLNNDSAMISAGLNLTGEEPATERPFFVDGIPAYSARGLAERLLASWSRFQ